MTATAGIMPEIMFEIYQHFLSVDLERAKILPFSLLPIIRAMFPLPFPLEFKMVMEMNCAYPFAE